MSQEITISPGDELTITVDVDSSIVRWMAERFKPLLRDESERVYTTALAVMVGISDTEAVQKANEYAAMKGWPERACVDGFRKWLPEMLSKLFAQEIPQDG